jgi:peptide/nickel transport system substrate-binding protein
MTARDVKASYDKIIFPPPGVGSSRKGAYLAVEAVEAPDPLTVRFRLKWPESSFLLNVASPWNWIYKADILAKDPRWYETHVMGTGPFLFVEHVKGSHWVGKKNPDYWDKGKPYLDGYRATFVGSSSAQVAAIRGERAHIQFRGFSPAERDTLVQALGNKITVQESPWDCIIMVAMNHEKKPFDDKRVRQALNYAVNKDAIVRDVLKGTGSVSKGPVLPGTWGDEGGLKPFPYDPERAKKLLAEAGLPSGFSTTLWVPESGSGMQSPVAMSTIIQSNLKAVGVNVTLQTMEWGTFLAKLRTKEQDMFALSWMAGSEDPDLVMYPLLHSSQWTPVGPNRALYKNTRFDEVLAQARLVTDQAKRAELYREAQRLLHDDPPWIFIDHEVQTAAFAKRVQGFKLHPSFDLRVETISLK